MLLPRLVPRSRLSSFASCSLNGPLLALLTTVGRPAGHAAGSVPTTGERARVKGFVFGRCRRRRRRCSQPVRAGGKREQVEPAPLSFARPKLKLKPKLKPKLERLRAHYPPHYLPNLNLVV